MEQILAFVLGVGVVLLIGGAIVMVKTVKKVERLEEDRNGILRELDRVNEFINRRIDQEINRTDLITKDTLSYIDSRVDKLEQKLTGTLGAKQVLKG